MENNFSFNDIKVDKLKTGKLALLDADFIKYIVCDRRRKIFETEQENGQNSAEIFIKEEPIITLTKNYLFENIFDKIDDPILFCWSGKSYNTFRNYVAFDKKYKGNRAEPDESYPGQFRDAGLIVEYIIKNFPSLIFDDLEADDIVAVLQDENTYIMSKDKDLKQVPGNHYDWALNKLYTISNEQAIYYLSLQMLTGDTTDNITGLPQIGPKKATDFLSAIEKPSHYIYKVLLLYQKKYGIFKGTDMFVETWNLIKMRENRGENFKRTHQKMFDTKEYLIRNLLK